MLCNARTINDKFNARLPRFLPKNITEIVFQNFHEFCGIKNTKLQICLTPCHAFVYKSEI